MLFKKKLPFIFVILMSIGTLGCQATKPVESFPSLQIKGDFILPAGDLGWIASDHISSDGRWLALTIRDQKYDSLWIYSLSNQKGTELFQIPTAEVSAGRLLLTIIGWTTDNRLIFARQGTQPDGNYRGERGLLLFATDPESLEIEELDWIPNPTHYIKQVLLNQQSGHILVHAGTSLWQLPLTGAEAELIRTDFPSYDGLFYLQPTVDNSKLVYQLFEPDRHGIYLLDIDSNLETCLAATGETFKFGPQWSPDGKNIAAYSADSKYDTPADEQHFRLTDRYNIISGEDAPAPIADAISIIDTAGGPVARLSVPDLKVGMFAWAPDSHHLGFLTAAPDDTGLEYPLFNFNWQSIYLANLDGAIIKVADLPADTSYVDLVRVSADGIYYLMHQSETCSLWWARLGQEPLKLDLPAQLPSPKSGSLNAPYVPATSGDSFFVAYTVADKTYYLQVWQDQIEYLTETDLNSFIVSTPTGAILVGSVSYLPTRSKLTLFTPEP